MSSYLSIYSSIIYSTRRHRHHHRRPSINLPSFRFSCTAEGSSGRVGHVVACLADAGGVRQDRQDWHKERGGKGTNLVSYQLPTPPPPPVVEQENQSRSRSKITSKKKKHSPKKNPKNQKQSTPLRSIRVSATHHNNSTENIYPAVPSM